MEDTREEHIEMAVTAFDKLAEKAMRRVGFRIGWRRRASRSTIGGGS